MFDGQARLLQTLTQIQDFPEPSRAKVILGHVGSFVWLLWVSLKSVGLLRAGPGWTLHGLPLVRGPVCQPWDQAWNQ